MYGNGKGNVPTSPIRPLPPASYHIRDVSGVALLRKRTDDGMYSIMRNKEGAKQLEVDGIY